MLKRINREEADSLLEGFIPKTSSVVEVGEQLQIRFTLRDGRELKVVYEIPDHRLCYFLGEESVPKETNNNTTDPIDPENGY